MKKIIEKYPIEVGFLILFIPLCFFGSELHIKGVLAFANSYFIVKTTLGIKNYINNIRSVDIFQAPIMIIPNLILIVALFYFSVGQLPIVSIGLSVIILVIGFSTGPFSLHK